MANPNYNLLSSVALFSDLFNNNRDKDIYDIISEFILAAVSFEKKYDYTIDTLYDSLWQNFSFEIPKSVVKNVVHKRLTDKCDINGGQYHFLKEKLVNNNLDEKFDEFNQITNEITKLLYDNIEKKLSIKLYVDEKINIESEFQNFLLDDKYDGKYVAHISGFLLNLDKRLLKYLDDIREGVMLHKGITYNPNLNELGKWQKQITFYLNTEHLFNATGLNGDLYKMLFDDFFTLIKEINESNKKEIIFLKYFPETKLEIEKFYDMGVAIKEGRAKLDMRRPAMVKIINSSTTPADVIKNKVNFFIDLEKLKIDIESKEYDVLKFPQYNLYSSEGVENIKKESLKTINHDELLNYIEIFSKIYMLRGHTVRNIDEVRHMFLTDNSTALYLAHNANLKISDNDISYAKDIGFYTNKFWFALKKVFLLSRIYLDLLM